MSDSTSTSKIKRPEGEDGPSAASTTEQIRGLSRRANDLLQLLVSQRELLRKRGMNLPDGALDSLKTLKNRVDNLAKSIVDTQVELKQLRALADTTALISSSQDTDAVLSQVMDTVIHLTGAERAYIVLRNRETDELEFRIARGLDEEQLQRKEFVISRTIVNTVFSEGLPILTDNASQDERYQEQQSIVGFALRSILAVPLKVRDTVIGVVYCDNRILAGLFKKHEMELLSAFANQAGVAIENARLFEAVRAQLAAVKEIRDLMDNIFTSIASGVITLDRSYRIIVSNTAARRILGAGDTLVSKSLDEVMPPIEPFFAALERVRDQGVQEQMQVETSLNGSVRYWNLIASPLRDDRGGAMGIVIVLDDLTEQKQHEAQVAEARRYLPVAFLKNISSIEDMTSSVQEREITSFACDVRGFTTFSERLEPQELMTIINKYLSLASDSIHLYEGIVDKYMGDAVTGLFNTHLNPQEDHALRAVQAGMQLIYDLHAHHEVVPENERLFYGVGIHTGPAVLGSVGSKDRKEFAALGEAVNISKYLEGNAGPGEVIISGQTYELVKDFYECEQIDPTRPKADYEHILLYRVVRRKRGAVTGALFIDAELLDLLKDD